MLKILQEISNRLLLIRAKQAAAAALKQSKLNALKSGEIELEFDRATGGAPPARPPTVTRMRKAHPKTKFVRPRSEAYRPDQVRRTKVVPAQPPQTPNPVHTPLRF